MTCELNQTFGELAACLPRDHEEQEDSFVLSAENLPAPPAELRTDKLCVTTGYHYYGEMPIESASLEFDKETCRHLGLWIFAHVFHRTLERVTLQLSHPRSTVRRIVLESDRSEEGLGLHSRPSCFNYWTDHPKRYPWLYSSVLSEEMPVVQLSSSELSSPTPLAERDTMIGLGSDFGACLLAALLLDAGLRSNPSMEYKLEGEVGYRGVGPGSAELSLWLPGGLGHLDSEVVLDA